MTNNEIIRGLECCFKVNPDCYNCPFDSISYQESVCKKSLLEHTKNCIREAERLISHWENRDKKYAQENHILGNRLKRMAEEMDNLKARNATVINIYCESLKGVETNDQTGNH